MILGESGGGCPALEVTGSEFREVSGSDFGEGGPALEVTGSDFGRGGPALEVTGSASLVLQRWPLVLPASRDHLDNPNPT